SKRLNKRTAFRNMFRKFRHASLVPSLDFKNDLHTTIFAAFCCKGVILFSGAIPFKGDRQIVSSCKPDHISRAETFPKSGISQKQRERAMVKRKTSSRVAARRAFGP